jgi:hypothetical protein
VTAVNDFDSNISISGDPLFWNGGGPSTTQGFATNLPHMPGEPYVVLAGDDPQLSDAVLAPSTGVIT